MRSSIWLIVSAATRHRRTTRGKGRKNGSLDYLCIIPKISISVERRTELGLADERFGGDAREKHFSDGRLSRVFLDACAETYHSKLCKKNIKKID